MKGARFVALPPAIEKYYFKNFYLLFRQLNISS